MSRCVGGGGDGAVVCAVDAGNSTDAVTPSAMKSAVCGGSAENNAAVTALVGTTQAVCWHTVIAVLRMKFTVALAA